MNKLIFIDDEEDILDTYKRIFKKNKDNEDLISVATDFFQEDLKLDNDKGPDGKYEVLTAAQGLDGIEIIKSHLGTDNPIKVAFVDMRMPPGIDGMETSKRIRQIDPYIEIVIVTAFSDSNLKEIVEEVGVPDKLLYLKKPFDIQEIKQLALNLTVKHRNEMIKDNFISSVSHELKTPLASILGFQQLLESLPGQSDDAKEYLAILGQSAQLMKNLIDDLLTTVEFKKVGVELIFEAEDICSIVKKTYRSLQPLWTENSNVTSKITIKIDGPRIISFDRIRIIQCLNNLLTNAQKYTEKGVVELILEEDDKNIIIIVVDTGIGIASEEIDDIFDKFSRIETEHHSVVGLGLGLSIVKNIMDAHHGTILAKSTLGEGSTFTMTLPKFNPLVK